MKHFIFLITTLTLIVSSTNAQHFDNSNDAWDWYKNLDPFLKIALEDANDYRKIKKKDVLNFIPFKNINVEPFKMWTDLEFLRDFTDVEKLYIPETIADYSLFQISHFSKLESLSLKGHNIDSELISTFNLPSLRTINIIDTKVRSGDFIKHFPNLDKVLIDEDQIPDSEIEEYKNILFETLDFPILPRKDWDSGDFFKYIRDIRYPEVAAEAGISGKAIVLAHVNPEGKVISFEKVSNLGYGIEEELFRVAKKVRFVKVEPSIGIQKIEMSMMFKLQ